MNKEPIERLALEVASAIGKYDDPLDPVEFATRFLAAYLAERGKEALGYDAIFNAIAKSADTGGGDIAISVKAFKAAIGGEIFLSQQIPEGMALVPIDPTDNDIDRILRTRIPGGSSAADWFLPHDTERGLENVRTVVRLMIAAAGVAP